MARTIHDVSLDNRSARAKLAPRKKAYFRLIEAGRHIGYYKGERGGSWMARLFRNGRYSEAKIGMADDTLDANGLDVFSFKQAQERARAWFEAQATAALAAAPVKPYTVADATADYLADYERRGGKDPVNTRARLKRIDAVLGGVVVTELKAKQVKDWHRAMADAGALTRSVATDAATGARRRRTIDKADPEAVRKRRASANRMLTVLKAALNHAFQHQPDGVTIPSRLAWESAKPFGEADAPKIRYLADAEAVRLMNACPPDFRSLVEAALLTGCRYGELCRLRVRDFDAANTTLRVEMSKSGKPRNVALTDEGVRHFRSLATGKTGDMLLLTRQDGGPWLGSHQLRRMVDASAAAKIVPAVSFHLLRHTYGSRLAMKGAPMGVIAAQLGHTDTRMTERHYAHLAPSYVAATVRAMFGEIGVASVANNVATFERAAA